jgi:hypothetical protein
LLSGADLCLCCSILGVLGVKRWAESTALEVQIARNNVAGVEIQQLLLSCRGAVCRRTGSQPRRAATRQAQLARARASARQRGTLKRSRRRASADRRACSARCWASLGSARAHQSPPRLMRLRRGMRRTARRNLPLLRGKRTAQSLILMRMTRARRSRRAGRSGAAERR